jgi:hypothetical protein
MSLGLFSPSDSAQTGGIPIFLDFSSINLRHAVVRVVVVVSEDVLWRSVAFDDARLRLYGLAAGLAFGAGLTITT